MPDLQPNGQAAVPSSANGADYGTMVNQRAALVQQFPVFSNISPVTCREIVSAAHEKEFSRRQTIFIEGDPVRQILLLTSGCVKITQLGPSGSEVILRVNGPGELIGALGLTSSGNHFVTARTTQISTGLVWEAAVFEAICDRIPVLRRNTARILSVRLQELEERFREISTQKVGARLSHQLVRLLSQVGRYANGSLEISLSREELAQLTGTTLFTVSRLLCKWEKRGIVKTRREAVAVSDLEALKNLSEDE
jgi:CRP/FNR family transcriptional regulator, nitrogen oxide reductase regulator